MSEQIQSKDRATSDPKARKDVLKQVEEKGIEDVLLWFTDLEGHLKSFSITIRELDAVGQVRPVPGVRQLVEYDDVLAPCEQPFHEVRADEAGAATDEDAHAT